MSSAISAQRLRSLLPPLDGPGPAYRRLYEAIRLLLLDGRISDGTRLPSERELAVALGVSRTTSTRVVAELRAAGLAESRRGSGTLVRLPPAASNVSSLLADADDPDTIALTYSAPVGPPGLARAFERAVDQLPGLLATTGYLPDGLPALREALAQRYSDAGLPTEPDQIIVTNGAMGAISLTARTLLAPGERVLTEGLSYPHGTDAFAAAGGRLSPMPVGETPWDAEHVATTLARGTHRTAYLVTDFHNPTAAVMDDATRQRLAALFRRHDVVPVIDESLRDINLDGIAVPAHFARHDPGAILLGSSSKGFWGGLRVGWLRAPRTLVMPLLQARMMDDMGTSAFDQLVLTELLIDGEATARAGRDRLRHGRDHLLTEVARVLPEVRVERPAGGLNLWLTLPGRISSRLTSTAERRGLLLTPGPRFFTRAPQAGERHLRLPFTLAEDRLTEAVRRLRLALDDVSDGGGHTTARAGDHIDLIA
ncbi:MAG TPA: PLP-dependent aminotransferase family protein [Aeromicrobium sp.]|nr:PLP-dependent aminotransferase family protein [Aeromicrobium sp.]